jgi:chromosome segregation protein
MQQLLNQPHKLIVLKILFMHLGAQQERLRSTMALAKERVRLGETEEEEVSRGRDPEEIDREAHALRVQESELAGQVDADRLALNAAISERTSAEAALAAEDARLHAATRAVADRREGLARIAGQVAAAKSRLDARSAEIERLDERLAEARDRADQAAQEFTALETQVAGMDAGELGLDSEHDESSRALADAEKELESAKLEEQEAERERAGAIARLEALEQGMARRDGGAAILAATDTMSGILGSVAALMQIENGWESAIAAALGSAADAIAVSSTDAAENAVRMLRRDDAGRAALVVVGQNSSDQSQWPTLSGSQRYAVDLISCDAELRSSLSGILQRVVVTNSLEEARQVVTANQTLRAVTRDGDLVGHGFVQGGSQGTQSLVEIQAAIDEARLKLEASAHRVDRAKFAVVGATQAQEAALVLVSNSLERLHESDASMAAIAVQLGSLQSVVRSATGEADRVAAAIASANKAREDDLRSVQELEARYAAAENDQISDSELSEESRESLVKTLEDVRQAELNVRLTVRTGEERVRALGTQAEQLEHSANLERTARARAIELRERRRREAQIAKAVVVASETALELLTQSVALAQFEREQAVTTRQAEEAEVRKIRERIRELTADLEVLTDSVHRDEVARAEQRLRIEAMENKSVEDYGVGPEELLAEYGPDVMVPPSPPAPGDEVNPDDPEPEPYPYVRTQQESRLAAAERSLALLGKVNPLALEEFSALEERHKFLGEQLEDLRKSRNDLMSVIRDVDARVQEVFSQAYEDTAREFMSVFSRLFPGGEARMILTEPNDLLNSGVEIEARPPGKTYKRLSLLSGGEQSLNAVAFLIALFKSRPSPFYILDEVEAALDDVNLGRLLEILAELRTNSQLLIITHQKRTMEIADALYGVSMRGDGVTQVISQRITHDDHDNPEQRADAQMANNS